MKRLKKITALLLALLMAGTTGLLTACGGGVTAAGVQFLTPLSFEYQTEQVDTVTDDFTTALADFSLALLRDSRAGGEGTTVSGLSVLTALAMAANGAEGETLQQILDVLGAADLETLNAQIYAYYAGLKSTDNAKLTYANAVWVTGAEWFTVDEDFIAAIGNHFDAQIASADFTDPATTKAINNWCKKQTDGMIPSIIKDGDLDAETVMALLNALCFDGKWAEEYEKDDISDGTFHGTDGDVTVDMLHSEESVWLAGENETGFVKYYKDGTYAFVGLLPNETGDIGDYLQSLSGETFMNLLNNRSYDTVYVTMPEFSMDTSLDLNDILSAMGMPQAFGYAADFTGMGTLDNPDERIYIEKVIHKTHIDVDRSGTKAAAITIIEMGKCMSAGPAEDPKYVVLDRPFVYAIVDVATSTPVFIGTVENITK